MQAPRVAAWHTWQQQQCSRSRQTAYAEVRLVFAFLKGHPGGQLCLPPLSWYATTYQHLHGLQASSSSAEEPGEISDQEVTGSDAWRRRPAAVRSCTEMRSTTRAEALHAAFR